MPYSFRTAVWATSPPHRWHFLTVPPEMADDIDQRTTGRQGGFGSVKVEVRIGTSTWLTSVFPSSEQSSYVLPVKKAVRVAQECEAGTEVDVTLRLVGIE